MKIRQTALDYYHAAMVFQHGSTVSEAQLAHALAQMSVAIDPSNAQARWLLAAAWDRMLMRQGKPSRNSERRPGDSTKNDHEPVSTRAACGRRGQRALIA